MSRSVKNINRISGMAIGLSLRVIVLAVVLLVVVKGAAMAYGFGHDIFYATSMEEAPGKDIDVTIPQDYDVEQTAQLLYDKGLIDNKLSYRVQSLFFDYEIKSGKYVLNTSQTSREILEEIDAGPSEDVSTTNQGNTEETQKAQTESAQ